ncbi:MAG TPA: hypothetical protein VN625_03585 [Desulfuromonadaceae bacterium]|nr:hypothetical protein [Desulfuromonadaceae bacterium]
MNSLTRRSIFIFLSLVAFSVRGQDDVATPSLIESSQDTPQRSLSLGYRNAFNIQSSFKHVGNIGRSNPGPATGLTDHFYDDGYNRVDSTGNNHFGDESTTFWGYQDSSQYDSSGSGTIAMHSASSTGAGSSGNTDNPMPGLEVVYSQDVVVSKHWHAGVEGAFNYQRVLANSSGPVNTTVTHVTDVYQLNGAIPPTAPYDGPADQPGTLLGDTPTRTITTAPETVTGSRNLEANLFGLRLGPYVEIPLYRIFSVTLSAGATVVGVESKYDVNQTITIDTGTVPSVGSDIKGDVLFGGYAGGSLSAALSDNWSAFVGAQWQHVGTYSHHSDVNGGGTAKLDLNNPIFVSAGVSFSF